MQERALETSISVSHPWWYRALITTDGPRRVVGRGWGLPGLPVELEASTGLPASLSRLSVPRKPRRASSGSAAWPPPPPQRGFCPTGMRILVTLLLDTLPMLGNVLLLCFFVFFIFGIVGVQLWAGLLRNRCFLPENFSL